MATASASIDINRPTDDVFAYVIDTDKMSRWQGEVLEAERLSEGPLAVGSRVRGVGSLLGRRIETTIEVTSVDPDKEFAFTSVAGPLKSRNAYRFEEIGTGTRVTESVQVEAGFFGLADPLLARVLRRQFETNLANLKDLLEADGTEA